MHGFVDRPAEGKRLADNLKPPHVQPGKVQKVVEQHQEHVRRFPRRAEVLADQFGHVGIGPRQIDHADDRVHRRAELVADVREELAFHAVGDFRLLLGVEEFLLVPDSPRDVPFDARRAHDVPLRVADRRDGDGDIDQPPVLPPADGFKLPKRPPVLDDILNFRLFLGDVVGQYQ